MGLLFEAGKINTLRLANRFVRSATWEGMASDEGACTPRLIRLMAGLAEGGVGLIISSHAYVRPEGQAGPWQLGVYKDALITGLKDMVRAVHERGGKIVLQLAHAGCYASQGLSGKVPVAPSAVEGLSRVRPKEMTKDDIGDVVAAFGEAALRAREAGFDGVQIHSAHGYLLSQFLSPVFNRRRDRYGGSIENRAMIHMEILRAIREFVGEEYPVLIKLNCQDFVENGLVLGDSIQVGLMLQNAGIDAIELSGGILTGGKLGPSRAGIKTEEKEAYFRDEARAFREKIHVPMVLVGGIRSYQVAQRLLKDGMCDYVSMSRPFIREPGLVNRWKSGDLKKAACLSDNQCFGPARDGEGIYCVTERRGK